MLKKYKNKLYIKVGQKYVEVELVFKDNDVDLKPTNKKLENITDIKFEDFDFISNKEKLIKEYKNTEINKDDEDTQVFVDKRTRKY